MKAERFDGYHKNGCHFEGKLVVVHYLDDAQKDPKWGTFGAELTWDYMAKAKQLIQDRGYQVKRVCLAIPDYVVEIE